MQIHACKMRLKSLFVLLGAATLPGLTQAGNVSFSLSSAGTSAAHTYEAEQLLIDAITGGGIPNLVPSGYTGTNDLFATVDYAGLGLDVSIPANLNEITLSIPTLGANFIYTGATRDAAATSMVNDPALQSAIEAYFQANQSAVVANEIVSVANPIIGNPSSAMPTVISTVFEQDFVNQVSNISDTMAIAPDTATVDTSTPSTTPTAGAPGQYGNLIGVGLGYSSYEQNGSKVDTLTLPLSYGVRNPIDPRRQFTFRAPITKIDYEGITTVNAGLGVSYRFPVSDGWTLTPSATYTYSKSELNDTVAQFINANLTSVYYKKGKQFDWGFGNLIGYNHTIDYRFKPAFTQSEFDASLRNFMMRNGGLISFPTKIKGKKASFEVSLADTRIFGSNQDLANANYQELSFTLGTNRSATFKGNSLRAGVTFMRSEESEGFSVAFGYWF